MKQYFEHLQSYYIEDLCSLIHETITGYNEEGFVCVDIQYSNMENNNNDCHAYLLFNEVKSKSILNE